MIDVHFPLLRSWFAKMDERRPVVVAGVEEYLEKLRSGMSSREAQLETGIQTCEVVAHHWMEFAAAVFEGAAKVREDHARKHRFFEGELRRAKALRNPPSGGEA